MDIHLEMRMGWAFNIIQVFILFIEIDELVNNHLRELNAEIIKKNDQINIENEIYKLRFK
jgi:hypothetical protein